MGLDSPDAFRFAPPPLRGRFTYTVGSVHFLNKRRFGAKLLYMSDEHVLGLSALGQVTDDIRLGAELFCSVVKPVPGG